ncbi:MAG: hypothetical protein FWD73_16625 [Polyangiaceae bacterium]|nr:hypothetical protein [Polyangiaceae bacterium]
MTARIEAAITAGLSTLLADILKGRLTEPEEVARKLVDLALDLVPVDVLRGRLDEEEQVQSERLSDITQAGGGS